MTPVDPSAFLQRVLAPGLGWVQQVADVKPNPAVPRFLLAVTLVETGLAARAQRTSSGKGAGPARGWFQFEEGTVGLLLNHPVSGPRLAMLCADAWVECEKGAIWRAIEGHDFLAVGVARLALLTDPHPVPTAEIGAWDCYANRVWRPGKPDRARFTQSWNTAVAATA